MFTQHLSGHGGPTINLKPRHQRPLLARINEIRRTIAECVSMLELLEQEIGEGHVKDNIDGPYDGSWRKSLKERSHLTDAGIAEMERRFELKQNDERIGDLFGVSQTTVTKYKNLWLLKKQAAEEDDEEAAE